MAGYITQVKSNVPNAAFLDVAGHFTQVVWKGSKELGVGRAVTPDGKIIVVANYRPAGNMVGSFAANVLPPKDGKIVLPPEPGKIPPYLLWSDKDGRLSCFLNQVRFHCKVCVLIKTARLCCHLNQVRFLHTVFVLIKSSRSSCHLNQEQVRIQLYMLSLLSEI